MDKKKYSSKEIKDMLEKKFTKDDLKTVANLPKEAKEHIKNFHKSVTDKLKEESPLKDDKDSIDPLISKSQQTVPTPEYLSDTYTWAYLDPKNVVRLDRNLVVNTLLFGNANRLIKSYLKEIPEGSKMLQLAHVYGDMVIRLANKIGPSGSLDLIDVAKVQLIQAYKKLKDFDYVDMWQQDATVAYHREYTHLGSFFLLHEVPGEAKVKIVNNMLEHVEKDNAKAIFIDYHNPSIFSPIRLILRLVNTFLEPFAHEMWEKEISEFAHNPEKFNWEKTTFFGGVYQKVVVTRK